MLTDDDVKTLIADEEKRAKICEDKAIADKDCFYEIGVFMHQSNVNFLKDVLAGKEKLTKASIQKMIKEFERQKQSVETGEIEKKFGISDQDAYRFGLVTVAHIDLLKEIYDRFYTEVKHRVSRKQRIAVLEKEIDESAVKLKDLHKCDRTFCHSRPPIKCLECQSFLNYLIVDRDEVNRLKKEIIDKSKEVETLKQLEASKNEKRKSCNNVDA